MSKKLGEIIPQQPPQQTRNEKYTFDDFVKAFGDFNTFDNASHYRVMQYLKYSQTKEEQDIFSIIEKVLSLQKALAPANNNKEDEELVKNINMIFSIIKSLNDPRLIDLVKKIVEYLASRGVQK
ncbi:conserved Acidianus plasmid protein [Acidianus hospitalis W1]|uniref:Conserved Acidianus plasmid protein n=1 Tax=Acidianus hospitalis (strain W1) TaxID=933801 RepID=F4B5K9_ACIHW|nr:hypothetical protein [Acidianus hospitalis]AEE94433.1 conserved Acidianus plasmid protein [Acidianus hospitalis W1]